MLLSIVIPVYNEEKTIESILKKVKSAKLPENIKREIVIVDDCSKDGTKDILSKINESNIKIFFHEINQGKGAALNTAYSKCDGDVIIVQDADLEYDPNDYIKLINPIIEGKADVVYGSRFLGDGPHRIVYFWHYLGNRILTLFSNVFSDLNLTDMETCYKVFRKGVIEKINFEEKRFGIEPEFTAKVAGLAKSENIRIYEVGISYYGRTYYEGKKIGLKDAFRAVLCIWRYNTTSTARVIKRFVNGILALFLQIFLLYCVMGFLGSQAVSVQNIANILSIESVILLSFIINILSDISCRKNTYFYSLLNLLIKFHGYNFVTILIRIIIFFILTILGINPYFNCLLCFCLAALNNLLGTGKHYSVTYLGVSVK